MQAQQLHDYIVYPTLSYMGQRYNTKEARMLLLATAAIESYMGFFVKQLGGIAEGIWQMEPATERDIWANADALKDEAFAKRIKGLKGVMPVGTSPLVIYPAYACAMARMKYAMSPKRLPAYTDKNEIYMYYKTIYNTVYGKSTFDKFIEAWRTCNLDKVKLGD